MHLIQQGRVKLIRHSLAGENIVLHVATAGEMIAEASFFSENYHCSAVADQPSKVLSIDRDSALNTIINSPQTSQTVMHLFAQQIRDLRGLHEIRNIRSAEQRVLAYLNKLANEKGELQLEMSLQDMAYKLGLAHETLYRALSKLEASGKIQRPATTAFILVV